MSVRFNARSGPIIVPVLLWGRGGSGVLRCVLDTGSTTTLFSAAALATLGYDPSLSRDLVEVTTASNVTYAPSVAVQRIRALDNERLDFPVLSITLPPSANVDGLLGLDFLRGQLLLLDFRSGEITLS